MMLCQGIKVEKVPSALAEGPMVERGLFQRLLNSNSKVNGSLTLSSNGQSVVDCINIAAVIHNHVNGAGFFTAVF